MQKKRSLKLLSSIFLIFLLSFSIVAISLTPALAREQSPEIIPGQVIVAFNPGASTQDINGFYKKFSESHGIGQIKSLDHKVQNEFDLQERLVKVPEGQERKFLSILQKNPHVEHVELNYRVQIAETTPDDSDFSSLWGMHNTGQTGGKIDADIDAPDAWDVTTGSSSVIVGVVDTGVDYNHPDLKDNVWINPGEIPGDGIDNDLNGYIDDIHGINTITGSGDPMDDNNHGTHVSGTIGGIGNNGEGVAGVNWISSIISCKFLNSSGSGDTANAIECMEYMNDMKWVYGIDIRVINHSWGGGGASETLRVAMERPDKSDKMIQIMAAGNSGLSNDFFPFYPASYDIPNKLVVAASDHNDNIASLSNYGANTVHLAAPGISIKSTIVGGGYANFQGTSMAAPHVAGSAALISSFNPTLDYEAIQNTILANVDPIDDPKQTITNGRLNIGNVFSGDITSPSQVTDLAVDQTGFSSVGISFTATGDDGDSGVASSYDVRYSTSSLNESTWNLATRVIGEPSPQSPGNIESFEISGLKSGTSYNIGIKVGDDAANQSVLSNIAVTTTDSGIVLMDDDIESGSDNWNPLLEGLWHQSSIRSNSPNTSWYYGDETQNNYDVNTSSGMLKTVSLDLVDAQEAQLVFFEWSEVESDPDFDTTKVKISIDGEATWIDLFESHGTGGLWQERIVDLSPFIGNHIIVGFEFDSVDGLFNTFEGWYVDDVKISKVTEEITSPSLISHYKFENNLLDTTGNGNHGSPVGPETYATGIDGQAFDFGGASTVQIDSGLVTTNPEYSIAAWVKRSGGTSSNPVVYSEENSSSITQTKLMYWGEDFGNGNVNLRIFQRDSSGSANSVSFDSGISLTDTDWHHIAWIQTSNTSFDVYVDGGIVGTKTGMSLGGTFTPDSNNIGSRPNNSQFYTGYIDDVQIYDFELTGTQVSDLHDAFASSNNAPVAEDDAHTTDEDTPVAVLLVATDADGDPLTYNVESGPSNGVLSGTAPDLTYTPNADYNGDDSFTFTANDGLADSNVATVSITVNPVNDAPVAGISEYTTLENIPLNIASPGVLANATDPDGDILTAVLDTDVSNGVLILSLDGSFSYAPNPDFNGIDSFTYHANDGLSDSNVATVSITVNPVNDAPIAEDGSHTTDEDTPVAVLLVATDADGDPLTYNVESGPSNGVLSGTAPDLTYTPNADYNGDDSFTFTANDGLADSNVATVSITVNPVNEAPVANAGPDQDVFENTLVALDGTESFDPEGVALTYQWIKISGPKVNLSDSTIADPTFTAPNVGPKGKTIEFELTVSDGTTSVSDTVVISILDK